ncbi:MAG: ATP-binding protein [Marmoricola sp.]
MIDHTGASDRPRRAWPQWELAAIVGLMVASFLVSRQLDLYESFHSWAARYERLGVDEIVLPALIGMSGFALYAWRRYRDVQAHAQRLSATERVLEAKSEHFQSLFEYNPTGIFSLDLDGRFVSANPASEQLSGYTQTELLGISFQDLMDPVELNRAGEVFASVISGCPQQLETRIVHQGGALVELSLTGVPIVVDGEVVGLFGIAQDIGERVRILDELERARLDAERTTELKSLFVANVSHEIRTPLTSVLAAIEMLQDTELDQVQDGLAATADRAGGRLLRLVEDLLDFSELESDRIKLESVAFLPEQLVAAVVDRLGPAARAKGLEFSCAIDPALGERVSGDLQRITQVLNGLVDNAVKFTESGWVRLSVELVELRPTAMDVRFVVQDSGIGLAPEQHEGLFESFSQVDPSISRPYEGAGLGLAICRRLVTLLGGSISVDSTPGAGSTFSFQLPLSRMSSAASAAVLSGSRPSQRRS